MKARSSAVGAVVAALTMSDLAGCAKTAPPESPAGDAAAPTSVAAAEAAASGRCGGNRNTEEIRARSRSPANVPRAGLTWGTSRDVSENLPPSQRVDSSATRIQYRPASRRISRSS